MSDVIVVLGGISATADVTAWWPELVGPGRALDTARERIIGFDFLEQSPSGGPVSTRDQAVALAAHLDALGIRRVAAIVGSSYGGMVALAFAAVFPARIGHAFVISAAHVSHPMTTALRSIQRRIVQLGLDTGTGREALGIARGLAMTTYRTAEEFEERFSPVPAGNPPRWDVEEYLESRGTEWTTRTTPERFLALSLSLDLHAIDPASITVPTTLVAVKEDRLVPFEQVRALYRRLPRRAGFHAISSKFGHDAFLKEPAALGAILRAAFASEAA
jgi:homoserine O-acetyltransferase